MPPAATWALNGADVPGCGSTWPRFSRRARPCRADRRTPLRRSNGRTPRMLRNATTAVRRAKGGFAPNLALSTQLIYNKQLTSATEFPFPIPFTISSWTQSHSVRPPETTTDGWRTGARHGEMAARRVARPPIAGSPRFCRAGRACHLQPLRGAPGPRGAGSRRRRDCSAPPRARTSDEAGAASGACREIWHVQELHEEAHGPGGIDLV